MGCRQGVGAEPMIPGDRQTLAQQPVSARVGSQRNIPTHAQTLPRRHATGQSQAAGPPGRLARRAGPLPISRRGTHWPAQLGGPWAHCSGHGAAGRRVKRVHVAHDATVSVSVAASCPDHLSQPPNPPGGSISMPPQSRLPGSGSRATRGTLLPLSSVASLQTPWRGRPARDGINQPGAGRPVP